MRVRPSGFHLASNPGERYCVCWEPRREDVRGSILYVHPFAEEMNKSRRMAALQAAQFAERGFRVLQIDLLGCGDSCGDFGEASWEAWLDDLDVAWRWLRTRGTGPMFLWGLRLGVLLAAQFGRSRLAEVASIIGWQPVLSGSTLLTQFFRLVSAAEMLSEGRGRSVASELLASVNAGTPVEVAGYSLSPGLARGIMAARLESDLAPGMRLDWLEIVAADPASLSPASERAIESLRRGGVAVNAHAICGEPFWASTEITLCPTVFDATMELAFAET